MPAPHSYDLRKRAMKHFERYGNATNTSEVFGISRSILYDWKKRKNDTGDIKAKAGYQRGYGHKVSDLKKFEHQVQKHAGLTLEGLVKQLGLEMSLMTCSRMLKKINMTRKKRPLVTKSKIRRNAKHI